MVTDTTPRSTTTTPRVRRLRDATPGREWRLWALDGASVPGGYPGLCLMCDSGDVVRRVWNAPAEWETWDDDALRALVSGPARRDPR